MRWKIYYNDNTVFSDEDGDLTEVPRTGVLVIVQAHPVTNRELLRGHDWYHLDRVDGQWYPHDTSGLFTWALFHLDEVALFAQGALVRNADWERIMRRAQNDPDFLPHSAGVTGLERK